MSLDNPDRRSPDLNPTSNPTPDGNIQLQTPKISVYEQTREERIKANLERMQKLGLKDLSLKLNSTSRTRAPKPRSYGAVERQLDLVPAPTPVRRSSRLQSVEPPSYNEVCLSKRDVIEEEGLKFSKLEVYSEEHEKLLGSTERSWTLFVDGYGKDGRRIYDPVKGKTCHQCRQKTLGHRTRCSRCEMVQGQFCGDCLYMRYGEHVLEALENPSWTCPVCRGICNCSLCRQSKGLAPTGTLYRKITKLGYKSVAHYLIQTKRQEKLENPPLPTQASAKRSLEFSNAEEETHHSKGESFHDALKTEEEEEAEEEHKIGSDDPPVADCEKETLRCSSKDEAADCEYAEFVSATPPKHEGRRETKRKGKGESKCEGDQIVSSHDDDSIGRRLRQRRGR